MTATNTVSYSINLNNVVENDTTRELFTIATRAGDAKVLDIVDAVSYYLYLDRFEGCTNDAFCESKVSVGDMRAQPYAAGDVAQGLAQLPPFKQADIWKRAMLFMASAGEVLAKNQVK